MATYTVTSADFRLTQEQESAIAAAITDAHHSNSGAPSFFVRVLFVPVPVQKHYVGGKPNKAPHLFIHGLIRAGRSADIKTGLIKEIAMKVSDIARLGPEDIWDRACNHRNRRECRRAGGRQESYCDADCTKCYRPLFSGIRAGKTLGQIAIDPKTNQLRSYRSPRPVLRGVKFGQECPSRVKRSSAGAQVHPQFLTKLTTLYNVKVGRVGPGHIRRRSGQTDRVIPFPCNLDRARLIISKARESAMRRRQFIAGLGSAAAWPMVARAQQGERMRRIGVLMAFDQSDPDGNAQLSAFTQGLAEFGWTDGRNLRMDVRWAAGNVDRMRTFAKELVGLGPDVILGSTTALMAVLQRETRAIPIVFAAASDPVGAGLVASLPRPGGNITGFTYVEAEMAGKWPELLTQIAPSVKRISIIFNPDTASRGGSYYLPSFEAAARSLKVAAITAPVHSDAEIESVITSLGRSPGSGLVVMPDVFTLAHRAQIILLAARNNVPVVYTDNAFARDGGLVSYGPDVMDIFRRSASYVDRILRGAKPVDLPVQLPVKFHLIVNLKAAKAIGLTIPESFLLRADKVIE